MFSLKSFLFVASCIVVAVSASSISKQDLYEPHQAIIDHEYDPVLHRPARSPEGGSVALSYSEDRAGREAALQYNQNLYKSGQGSVDAYARGSRNFDYNRNDYAGGISGTWRF